MIDCACDYESMPEFYSAYVVKARKEHRCNECRGAIRPGENYERTAGRWEGDFSTYKTCERCFDLRTWVKNNIPCFCWLYTEMHESAMTTVRSAQEQAPEETRGLYFALLRRLVKIKRHNRQRTARRKNNGDGLPSIDIASRKGT